MSAGRDPWVELDEALRESRRWSRLIACEVDKRRPDPELIESLLRCSRGSSLRVAALLAETSALLSEPGKTLDGVPVSDTDPL